MNKYSGADPERGGSGAAKVTIFRNCIFRSLEIFETTSHGDDQPLGVFGRW
jgi:hypothetical protein